MSTYQPQEGVFAGRPPCASCHANFQLHRPAGAGPQVTGEQLGRLYRQGVELECPEAYRPASLEEAQRGLEQAERSGDQARVFIARGELQRLRGR